MWNWFSCFLSGRHEYGVWCDRGAIFLRCVHCGRRSPGWEIGAKGDAAQANPSTHAHAGIVGAAPNRVLPFDRAALR